MKTLFWYIYATDGNQGFLLDLISRPTAAEARLLCYSPEHLPVVLEEIVPREELRIEPNQTGVRLAGLKLDTRGCSGSLGDIHVEARIHQSGRGTTFVPAWVSRLVGRVPHFSSLYGVLSRGECRGVTYEGVPLVYSTYQVGDLAAAEWILVSATYFQGTDLLVEISASRLFGFWAASAYVFFQGQEYKLNSIWDSLAHIRVVRAGEIIDGRRVFAASVKNAEISLEIEGTAPVPQFGALGQEGTTRIHTTLFGDCRASIQTKNSGSDTQTYHASRRCLLEVKS